MNNSKPRLVGISFLFAMLITASVPVRAVTISFNDSSDNDMITVAVDGTVQATVDESKTMSISRTLQLAANATATVNDFFTLTEKGGGLSDILTLATVAGSRNYTITFTSDFVALKDPPRAPFGTAEEIAGFLSIRDKVGGVQPPNSFPFPTDQPHPAGLIIEMSSAPEVPLPTALPLFATGLGALGLLGWRKKKKAAAAGA